MLVFPVLILKVVFKRIKKSWCCESCARRPSLCIRRVPKPRSEMLYKTLIQSPSAPRRVDAASPAACLPACLPDSTAFTCWCYCRDCRLCLNLVVWRGDDCSPLVLIGLGLCFLYYSHCPGVCVSVIYFSFYLFCLVTVYLLFYLCMYLYIY